jgi:hypothetical protein
VPGTTGLANVCASHYSFLAQREAELFCDAQGLVSVDDKRAYCRLMMGNFGRLSFEAWARSLTPGAVKLLVRMGDSKCLAKLRDAGFIDMNNQLVQTT